jgi:transglutaminase-like putative cysteine protease
MNATRRKERPTSSDSANAGTQSNTTIPPPNATSNEVREFLISELTTKHDLPSDQVQSLVRRWTVGRGHELRSYPAAAYLDLFGRDVGWVLYRDIQLEIYRTRRKTFWESRGVCAFYVGIFLSILAAADKEREQNQTSRLPSHSHLRSLWSL